MGSTKNLNSNKIRDQPVLINNVPIPGTEQFTCLGVELNRKLNWDKAYLYLLEGERWNWNNDDNIKPYVPSKALQDIYNGLVMPYFDYCSSLWDTCGKERQDKIQKYQNRPAMQGCRWR